MARTELTTLAFSRVRNGSLPCADVRATYSGAGRGAVCNVCQVPILAKDVEFEVALIPVAFDNPKLLQFHLHCYEAWAEACRRWREKSELAKGN